VPQTPPEERVAYEAGSPRSTGDFAWRSFPETTAAGMCYTSGTTAIPKGVVYSHRSNVLHSMIASAPGRHGRVVQRRVYRSAMFHATAGACATSPMQGAALVMPGAKLDARRSTSCSTTTA